ncbi:MAG: chemotaxis protein CheR [Rhodobacteraceae bacterium]|nr:chemotaxis protein CheR [Paracoccaceae bacterium]
MHPDDFEFVARLLKDRSGLVLTRDKGYLVENRLMPLVRQRRMKGINDVIAGLRAGEASLTDSVVDAMMAKDTAFFRDWKPFEHFRTVVLPNLIAQRGTKKTFRVLCAGVSTGQEAYSLAIIMREYGRALAGWKAEIVGVDISAASIATAQLALYSQFDVQRGLPIRLLLKHFKKRDESWSLNGDIQGMVGFMRWNLMDDLFPLGRFDVILCRNVLVYNDLQTKFNVLQKLARVAADDGVLYVGRNEPLTGVSSSFKVVNPDLGVYTVTRAEKATTRSLADAT